MRESRARAALLNGVRWLLKHFTHAPPPPPVLLRVAEQSGARPAAIDVECTWYPSGRTASRRHRTASGLCVIPWYGEEERVELRVRTERGSAAIEVDRDRSDGRVREVELAS